jgi:hypothetical protein
MISIEEAKDRYQIKAEKNGINDNLTTDNYRFCLNFNESQNKFLTLHLQQRGVDDVRYIQNFLVLDEKILPKETIENKVNFELPILKNKQLHYFDFSSARAKAKKGSCQDYIELIEVRTENLNELLYNEHTKPSFPYRESLCTINSNILSVYVDDFSIDSLLLNYYRYPNQIRLINSENPESGFDSTKQIEWDDKSLDDIISIMVSNYDINQNSPRFQLQTLRAQK